MSILFLAVNYHSEPDTLRLAEDLLAQEGEGASVLAIIDNTAHLRPAPRLKALAERSPRVRYLEPGTNLGYFGAAAWGRARLLEAGIDPEWTIVSNTDIRIPDTRFVQRLLDLAPAAVVAPRIISGLSGRDQNPYLTTRPSGRRMRLYARIYAWHWGLVCYDLASRAKKWFQRPWNADAPPAGPIYAAHGAFIIFHRSYFAAGGGLHHGTFLFNEEIMVAESARHQGLVIRYEPSLEVHHAEHANTSFFSNRVVARHMADSARYTAETWFGEDQ